MAVWENKTIFLFLYFQTCLQKSVSHKVRDIRYHNKRSMQGLSQTRCKNATKKQSILNWKEWQNWISDVFSPGSLFFQSSLCFKDKMYYWTYLILSYTNAICMCILSCSFTQFLLSFYMYMFTFTVQIFVNGREF